MENTMEILSEELVKVAIMGALEGVSNYWYYLPDSSLYAVRNKVPHSENPFLAEALADAVYMGAVVLFRDAVDKNVVIGTLSKEGIDKGLYQMLSDGCHELDDMRSGNDDAETYDVMLQYFIVGELRYG